MCDTIWVSPQLDTDQCLKVAISFYRQRSVPVPCENGSVETNIAEEVKTRLPDCGSHTIGHLSRLPVTPPSTFDVKFSLYFICMVC